MVIVRYLGGADSISLEYVKMFHSYILEGNRIYSLERNFSTVVTAEEIVKYFYRI